MSFVFIYYFKHQAPYIGYEIIFGCWFTFLSIVREYSVLFCSFSIFIFIIFSNFFSRDHECTCYDGHPMTFKRRVLYDNRLCFFKRKDRHRVSTNHIKIFAQLQYTHDILTIKLKNPIASWLLDYFRFGRI